VRQNEEEAASGGSEFQQTLRSDYETVSTLAADLAALDAAWGQAPGTNLAVMTQRLINGEEYPLDIPMRDAVRARNGGADTTVDNPRAIGEFLQWRLGQPAGTDASIETYNAQWRREQNERRVADLAMLFATGQAPMIDPLTGTAPQADPFAGLVLSNGTVSPGVRPGPSRLARDAVLATEPGGTQGVRVPANAPVMTTPQMVAGSDGSTWMYVDLGSGVGGWVDVTSLQPMA